jgi:hypothetical protein
LLAAIVATASGAQQSMCSVDDEAMPMTKIELRKGESYDISCTDATGNNGNLAFHKVRLKDDDTPLVRIREGFDISQEQMIAGVCYKPSETHHKPDNRKINIISIAGKDRAVFKVSNVTATSATIEVR